MGIERSESIGYLEFLSKMLKQIAHTWHRNGTKSGQCGVWTMGTLRTEWKSVENVKYVEGVRIVRSVKCEERSENREETRENNKDKIKK